MKRRSLAQLRKDPMVEAGNAKAVERLPSFTALGWVGDYARLAWQEGYLAGLAEAKKGRKP